jgi:hemerythrin
VFTILLNTTDNNYQQYFELVGVGDMKDIEWDDSLLIGNELIDLQHKRLIKLIGAIPEGKSPGDELALDEAIVYAETHFADEEELLEQIGYPELSDHMSMHEKMTARLESYKQDYDDGKTDLYAFKLFMYNWIKDHIMREDKKIGAYLRASGKQ